MQTTTDNTGKERVLKILAVGGFVALIIIIAWLGIQIVRVAPKALDSLASLADSVYNHEDIQVDVASNKAVANADESFGLSWHVPKTPGLFTFAYSCTDGIAIDVRTIGSDIVSATCGDDVSLGDVSGVDVIVHSEKTRFTDIPYSVTFVPTNTNVTPVVATSTITVVNASIPLATTATTTPTVIPTPEPTPVVVTPSKPVVVVPTKPVVKPAPKPTVKLVTTYTYAIPVSNPNGYTDLAASFVKVGNVSNGTFTTSGTVNSNQSSALLFAIKNIGTKTSNTFTYTVTLPNGTTYTSPVQEALKPNERAQIGLGFDTASVRGLGTFSVTVNTTGESTLTNNSFTGSVQIY